MPEGYREPLLCDEDGCDTPTPGIWAKKCRYHYRLAADNELAPKKEPASPKKGRTRIYHPPRRVPSAVTADRATEHIREIRAQLRKDGQR